ncbi:MAG: DUF4847 family protein [Bacteroidaceae bacterium]|nr:DUF4847 family protein [Bacteroidaceae bacterium]
MRHYLYIVISLMLMCAALSCDKSDDVSEIFTHHEFKITGITFDGIKVVKEVSEFYAGDGVYWLTFSEQALHGMLQADIAIEGNWHADGNGRTLTISLSRPTTTDGMSELCRKVYGILRDATAYSGDKNVIRIYKTSDTYIDLSSMK